ncbi:MAG TPA: efflux RND transporter periplasmic adaptor subunit [Acetobacteraceae bacterium]|nr:efflux RND transporter periplasmic adaptor subunit [Acetobacteraceae bacterium]
MSRPRRRRALVLTVSALALLAAVGVGSGRIALPFRPAPAPVAAAAPAPVPVSVAAVPRREAILWTEFSGRVEAVDRVEVRPRVAGAIVAVHFREGAMVHKGDVLFTIDPAPYAAEVQRTDAQLATAQAQLVLAAKEQARGRQLVGDAIPQRDLDQRVNTLAAAQAGIRSAEAQLAIARLNLGWTDVRAPIDGRIGKIEVTPGNLVPAGPTAPVLTTLVSVNPIYASFEADEQTVERALASLPPGSGIEAIPVTLGTLAKERAPEQGKLQFVDNVVDPRSGTIRLRGVFENVGGTLIPGQFARMRLGQPKPEKVIAVSERAIGTDQDRRFVLVVGDDGKAVPRQVQLGGVAEGLRIVTAGLEGGERVVVNGLQRVRPGATVNPQLVPMEAKTELATR